MQDHASLLKLIPEDARRIHVLRENGDDNWISLEDLLDTDTLVLRKDGVPESMRGTPGRKKREPLPPVSETAAQLMDLRQDSIQHDPLVKAVRENAQSDEVFGQVMSHLAEISAVLRFERKEAERLGFDPTKMSTIINRQMAALKSVADTVLKHKELTTNNTLNLDGQEFQVIFEFILDTFRGSMNQAGCRPELVETVFSDFIHMIGPNGSWMEEAKNRLKKLQ